MSSDPSSARHRAHGGSRSHNRPQPTTPATPSEAAAEHDVRPAQRIWLQENGVRMFGPGTNELLRRVDETGSLNQAAKDMAMSYSKAWRIVREVEQRLGVVLFERRTGGPDGGGSCLTYDARQLLGRFEAFTAEADEALQALFVKHFGDLPYAAADVDEVRQADADEVRQADGVAEGRRADGAAEGVQAAGSGEV